MHDSPLNTLHEKHLRNKEKVRKRRANKYKDSKKSLSKGENRYLDYLIEENMVLEERNVSPCLLEVRREYLNEKGLLFSLQPPSPAIIEQRGLINYTYYDEESEERKDAFYEFGVMISYILYHRPKGKHKLEPLYTWYFDVIRGFQPGRYDLSNKEYKAQLELELELYLDNNFVDIVFNKERNIKESKKEEYKQRKGWLNLSKWYNKYYKDNAGRTEFKNAIERSKKYGYGTDEFDMAMSREGGYNPFAEKIFLY